MSVKSFFSRVWSEIDSRFSRPQVKREHVLLYSSLALILIGALLLRILSAFESEILLRGLDPWIQYKCAQYINEYGLKEFLNWYDQTTWYPYGRYMGKTMYIMVPLTAVIFYKIALFLGFNTTMLTVCYFVPAIFGTLTVFVIYKLGSVLHSKRTGLFSAFFVSVAMGFMSRSIAGFYDNECIGIFFMFLTFYFFVKGLTKDSIINSILAGVCLGGLSLTWGAYRFGYELLALYALLMILLKKYSRRLLMSFSLTITIGLVLSSLIPRNGMMLILSTETLIPVAIIVLMLLISFYQFLEKNIEIERLKRGTRIGAITAISAGIIALIFLYAFGLIRPIASKFLRTLLPTLAETLPLIESVAENQTAAWSSLFSSVYLMVFMIPLGLYFCIKKPNEKTMFILIMGLAGAYFGGSMVRLSLIFAPTAAIVTGYTIDEVLRPFALIFQERFTLSRRKMRATTQMGRELIALTYIFLAVILMMTAIFGTTRTNQYYGEYHELLVAYSVGNEQFISHDYQETFDFIKNNIAPYSPGEKPPIIMSWWDYGYQIRVLGNVTVLVDNATINSTQIGVVGAMLISNESYSAKLCKQYGVDYVLVLSPGILGYRGHDLSKSQWMMKISEEHTPELGVVWEDYYKEIPLDEGGGYQDKFWNSVVYRLCAYKLHKEGYADNPQIPVSNWRVYDLQMAPDIDILSHFELVFQSSLCVLRIYRVLY